MSNKIFPFFIITFVIGAMAIHPASAAPDIDTPKSTAAPKIQTLLASDIKTHIVPHRAIYTIKLAGTKNGSAVSDITGRMYYEWADDCSDWNVEQKMQVRFYYSEGDVTDTSSSLISRESKDGTSYDYHVKRLRNGKTTEIVRGNGKLNVDSNGIGTGQAEANGKENKKYQMDTATAFPVHHTLHVLAHALAGKKFFAINVFDGADENGFNEISTFIGNPITPEPSIEKAKSENDATHLTRVRGWPVRMAYFTPDATMAAPDYEMDITLLENGVIKDMAVDYDDFAMHAELVKIQSLPPAKCSKTDTKNQPKS